MLAEDDIFINIINGPARKLFFKHCGDEMKLNQLASVNAKKYDSDARRFEMQSELEVLALKKLMLDRDITNNLKAFTKIIDHIKTLTSQWPHNFHKKSNKICFLRHAFLEFLGRACEWKYYNCTVLSQRACDCSSRTIEVSN